jgi:hypothetical protein
MQSKARQVLNGYYAATDAAFELVLSEAAQLVSPEEARREVPAEIRDLINSDSWAFDPSAWGDFRLAA